MTGSRIRTTLKAQKTIEAIDRLIAIEFHVMEPIGLALVQVTQERFRSATTPQGVAWAALNPAYAAIKRGPGILRESEMLMRSITFKAGSREVEVGSNRVYAAVQQFGATIKPKNAKALRFEIGSSVIFSRSVTIPARPYLGFGKEDRAAVLEVIEAAVQSALG